MWGEGLGKVEGGQIVSRSNKWEFFFKKKSRTYGDQVYENITLKNKNIIYEDSCYFSLLPESSSTVSCRDLSQQTQWTENHPWGESLLSLHFIIAWRDFGHGAELAQCLWHEYRRNSEGNYEHLGKQQQRPWKSLKPVEASIAFQNKVEDRCINKIFAIDHNQDKRNNLGRMTREPYCMGGGGGCVFWIMTNKVISLQPHSSEVWRNSACIIIKMSNYYYYDCGIISFEACFLLTITDLLFLGFLGVTVLTFSWHCLAGQCE